MSLKEIIKNIVLILLLLSIYIFVHELTHLRIYDIYDCTDIEMGFAGIGTYTSANCPDEAKLATAIHEIIGYTVVPFIFVILFYIIH